MVIGKQGTWVSGRKRGKWGDRSGGTDCQISDVQFARLDLEPLDTILLGSANLFEEDPSAERVRKLLEEKNPLDVCAALLRLPTPRAHRGRSITAVVVRLGSAR